MRTAPLSTWFVPSATATGSAGGFHWYGARDGEGKRVLKLSTYRTTLCVFLCSDFCGIWVWTKLRVLPRFPGALIQRMNVRAAGSRGGSSLSSQRFALYDLFCL